MNRSLIALDVDGVLLDYSKFDKVATELLHNKGRDPIGAVIGAYFLLRMGRWKQTDPSWFDNLYHWFPWSSDAALTRHQQRPIPQFLQSVAPR